MREFDWINQYLKKATQQVQDPNLILGIGDDAAVLNIPDGQSLAISVDTLLAGVHFPKDAPPDKLAVRALAVNLSDMAAMGAEPKWVTLSLTLPTLNQDWLAVFADSFFASLAQHQLNLIGGDTCQGPLLSITIQIHGLIPQGMQITRQGAKVGDKIYVSGACGAAAAAIPFLTSQQSSQPKQYQQLSDAFYYPEAQIELGLVLREQATAAIDISDGFLQDLSHILKASGVGAVLHLEHFPVAELASIYYKQMDALRLALTGGDDYQLCFTLPKERIFKVTQGVLPPICVGEIVAGSDCLCYLDNEIIIFDKQGYQHGDHNNGK